jgi:hypothetical protein
MTSMFSIWLPVLVSAVIVFILSSIFHMVLPWHKNDYPHLATQDAVMDALRPLAIPPGEYMIPKPEKMSDLRSPEFAEKANRGPVLMLHMLPNGIRGMGVPLAQYFVYLVVVAAISGHIAQRVLPTDAPDYDICHTVGLAAFMGYALALWQGVIWYRRSVWTAVKMTIDGIVYAFATACVFAWLWPR